jgi:hypothetical protein
MKPRATSPMREHFVIFVITGWQRIGLRPCRQRTLLSVRCKLEVSADGRRGLVFPLRPGYASPRASMRADHNVCVILDICVEHRRR